MKINVLLGAIVIVLGYVTCKNLQKSKPTSIQEPIVLVEEPQNGPAGINAAHVLGSNDDTSSTVQIHKAPRRVFVPIDDLPKATASRRAYLASGFWHCTMAFVGTDSLVHKNYQSKWLRFREDQTFDVLIKGQVADSGRWAWDENKNQIFLSCKDTYINNSWQVQDKGFVMVWLGNTDLNVTGIQVRVISKPRIEG